MNDYAEFVATLTKPLPTTKERLYHAILGLIGEVGEIADCYKKYLIYEQPLNKTNMLEELGDLRFYIQMILNELGYNDNNLEHNYGRLAVENLGFDEALFKLVGDIAYLSGDIMENNTNITGTWILVRFKYLCHIMQFKEDQVIKSNIEKLQKRYPENKFTTKHANERLDKKEVTE